ncbi:MAG: F0F1 ATP synthase subunit delta [bacterium]
MKRLAMKIKPKLKKELKRYLLNKIIEDSQKAFITSAYKLSSDEIQDIKAKFPSIKKRKISFNVNEDIIGGFIIKEGSKITDYSIKTKLEKIKKNIYEITR